MSIPGDVSRGGKSFMSHWWWSQCCGVCCGSGWWGSAWEWGLVGSVVARSCPGMVVVCLVGGPGDGGSTRSTSDGTSARAEEGDVWRNLVQPQQEAGVEVDVVGSRWR